MQAQLILSSFTALFTLVIAIASTRIANRQALTNEEKLRLDLYNKRFEIYRRSVDFYQVLESWDGSEQAKSVHKLFIIAKLESVFLFEPESGISQTLEDMHKRAFKVIGFREHGKDLSTHPPTYIQFYGEAMDALPEFSLSIKDLQTKMEPYLNFHQVR